MQVHSHRRIFRLFYRIFLFLILLLIALRLALPSIGEKIILSQIKQMGADQASLQTIDLNFWQGQIQVNGLRFHVKHHDPFYLSSFKIQLLWPTWNAPKLIVDQITLNNTQFTLNQTDAGWSLNGLIFPSKPAASKTEQDETANALPWQLNQLNLENIRFKLHLKAQSYAFSLNQCQLQNLDSTQPAKNTLLNCHLSLAQTQQTAHLHTQLTLTPLAKQPVLKGQIQLADWDLQSANPYLSGLKLAGLLSSQIDTDIQLVKENLTGQLKIDNQIKTLSLQQAEQRFTSRQIRWQQQAQFNLPISAPQTGQIQTQIELKLSPSELHAQLKNEQTTQLTSKLNATLKLNAQLENEILSGDLSLNPNFHDLKIQQTKQSIQNQQLAWQQHTQFKLPLAELQSAQASTELALQLKQTEIQGQLNKDPIRAEWQNLAWQGQINWSAQQPSLKGKLTLSQLNSQLADLPLLSWHQFTTQLELPDINQVTLSATEIDQLRFGQQIHSTLPQLQLAQTRLEKLLARQGSEQVLTLALDQLHLSGLEAHLSFDSQNQLLELQPLLTRLKAANPDQQTESTTNKASSPAEITLSDFRLAGDNRMILKHPSVDNAQPQTFMIKDLSLSKLQPHQPQQVSSLNLNAQFNDFTQIQLKGEGSWLDPLADLDLHLKIDDLNLTTFSPFIEPILDEQIRQGNLSSTHHIQIKQAHLDSQNHLLLSQLELLPPPQTPQPKDEHDLTANEAVQFSTLNYSLNILRNDHNQISLELPVKGDVNSPEFEFKSVFKIALYKALAAGSKQLIMMSLQPYSTFYSVGALAYGLATEIRLQSIEFQPGLVVFESEQQNYLAKIQKLMQNQPKLQLKLCGAAGEMDQSYLLTQVKTNPSTDQALSLALKHLNKQRQDSIKKQLVELGIDSKRITTCLPNEQIKQTIGQVNLAF